jgi:hypothetical protein
MTDRPPPKRTARRVQSAPPKIKTGPNLSKVLPYAVAVVVIGVLVLLIRTPRFTSIGAFLAGLAVMAGLSYVGMSYRESLPPSDRLRVLLPIVTIATMLAAAIPFGYTIFPPRPRGVVSLAHPNDAHVVEVNGTNASIWLSVHGRFAPGTTLTENANYFLTVRKDDGASEHVSGSIHPHAGGPLPEMHALALRGPGHITVQLDQSSPNVAMPLTVDVNAKPFSTLMLIFLYAAFAAAAVAIDAMLWRRGVEPSFAGAMLVPLVAVAYFQRHPVSSSMPMDLLAAAVIGALGGGLGGEILARVGRLAVKRDTE